MSVNNKNPKIIYTKNDLYKILSENKDRIIWNESKDLLFDFCTINKKCAIKKEKYKNNNIGIWIIKQKRKINNTNNDLYKILSENIFVKESLDKYLEFKDKNKNIKKSTWDESKDLLFDFCTINKKCAINKDKFKNNNIGKWLSNQKKRIYDSNNDLYKKLSKNIFVKESLDEHLKFKYKEKIKWNESKDLLFDFCNIHKRCPIYTEQYKNNYIGMWLEKQIKDQLKTHIKDQIKERSDIMNDLLKILSNNVFVKKYLKL
jgi:hypothetical protein